MLAVVTTCILWVAICAFLLYITCVWISFRGKQQLKHLKHVGSGSQLGQGDSGQKPVVVGFFHPYCNAGGGGERVLWVAIKALQTRYSYIKCVIYTGDVTATRQEIIQKARDRFNIILPKTDENSLEFVYLKMRKWVEPKPYPYFTMLGQSLGSIVLGVEAMWKYVPDIYLDSMGYAFTLPLFKYFGGCSVCCYVHYPTISTDMLERVSLRTSTYNNTSTVSRSPLLSRVKLAYYRLFAYMYGLAGKRSDLIMVNSSWTEGHILSLWQAPSKTYVVYPPCDTNEFLKLSLNSKSTTKTIASVAQFRPEKDHPLQLKAFSEFLRKLEESDRGSYKLVLVGSCRNEEDRKRVEDLKNLASELNIKDFVEFRLNIEFSELKQCLQEATVGLHTMWNEHFGIGVVEMMAAGTIVLAHNSGGPKLDIVKNCSDHKSGFLADSVESYAEAMEQILRLSEEERLVIQQYARQSVERFSSENFEHKFIEAMKNVLI